MAVADGRIAGRPLRIGAAVSLRVRSRSLAVTAVLLLLALALFVVEVGTGDFPIAPADVASALVGAGDQGTEFIVRELRLPRAICAVLVGIALGISGAVFQSLTRNPLGSPDVIGFDKGASVGALFVITVLTGSGLAVSIGAFAGGAVSAAAVYLLAYKRGGTSGYRLILVGIAIGALALSLINYLLSRARIEEAQEATRWLLGSLNNRGWEDVVPLLVTLAVVLPAVVAAGPALRVLELGDDAAYGLGLRVERARFALAALAVALVSIATVAVGPVVFVALTAPQIARRLVRSAAPPLVCSALCGAVIMLASDVAAQRIVPDTALPVGVMTGTLGGLYLAWLLTTEWRSGRA
jgi:iron-siderophore transport system permease protein